ncbi:MAG: glutamine--fructose-6-phosphate transaminase (isomerizing) [Deltaproteobacteria bacterium]
MCGIVGYIGSPDRTVSVLLDGLRRLEYRGYDSSGVAVLRGERIHTTKCEGKLANLVEKLGANPSSGSLGLGHTRWATHGAPSERNAHPHVSGKTAVVHNGIIENYRELREELQLRGYEFKSDTDTEVIAHLVEDFAVAGLSLEEAVRAAFGKIEGSYAVGVISEREPDKIIGLRKFSPLILALGRDENFFASDIPAVLPYTKKVIFLEDGDLAVVERGALRITDMDGRAVQRKVTDINWDPIAVEKCGYKHFMLKEIHEQPQAILNTIRGRFSDGGADVHLEGIDDALLAGVKRIVAVGCGTSYHACLVGKRMIESLAGISVEVDLASEFRYRDPLVSSETLIIAVSQSGETADTSEALLEAKKKGAKVLAITNVQMSKIAREAAGVIYTQAGPEIGVASTKAFTTQLIAYYFLAICLGRRNGKLAQSEAARLIRDGQNLYQTIQAALKTDAEIHEVAREYHGYRNFLYLGRGISHPIALEGALKLKEISYIHAEAYAAGEMKHGPIALIDENMPVVVIAPQDEISYKKILGNLEEIKARRAKVIFITSEDDAEELRGRTDKIIRIPRCNYFLSPIVSIIPLQLLAYHIATFKGTDVDQPRNLAKVVTVE